MKKGQESCELAMSVKIGANIRQNWWYSLTGSDINLYASISNLMNDHVVLQKVSCVHSGFNECKTDPRLSSTREQGGRK